LLKSERLPGAITVVPSSVARPTKASPWSVVDRRALDRASGPRRPRCLSYRPRSMSSRGMLLAARSAARLQPSRPPSPAPYLRGLPGRADGFPPRRIPTRFSRSTSSGNSCVSRPDLASARTDRGASFSGSLQARARRMTRCGRAPATPEGAFDVVPLGGGLDPPAPSPVGAHSGSQRAIPAQRDMSAASLRGGRVGRLLAGRYGAG